MTTPTTNVTTTEKPKKGGALIMQHLNNISIKIMIEKALGEQAGAFSASLIELYGSDTNLSACDPAKVISEAMKAVSLKLPIVKAMGFAYIVAYKAVPTLQIGYKGYIQLAMRTGQYKHLNSGEVFEGEFISRDKLTGEVNINGTKTGEKVVGYFAHFETLNGFRKTLYWTVEEVKTHAKRYSKTYPNFTWKDEFDKMAIKTVLRNLLSHWGYLSVEMVNAFSGDDESAEQQSNNSFENNANKTELKADYSVDVVNTDTGEVTEGMNF